jgi:parallel beta-helix repeat protein
MYAGFAISGENNIVSNCIASNNEEGFFEVYSVGKNNLYSNCIATNNRDAGFLFFGGTDNTLQGCTASNNGHGIVVFNFYSSVAASWRITGSNVSSNLTDGFLILTANTKNMDAYVLEKNTVNENAFTGINCIGSGNFTINKNTCNKNAINGILLGDFSGTQNLSSNTIQQNITQFNGAVGLELYNVNNSFVLKNASTANTVCDFTQTLSSGNTLTGNQFGTDCSGL